ncbi:MAG: NYN domain-containing protein [Plesiomonas shigelloides]
MKTRIYVDGYNLYFGCLKGTPYKWLDLIALSERLLARSGTRNAVLDEQIAVKFFTAEISEKAAPDPNSLVDQRAYHLALHNHSSPRLQTIKGSYSISVGKYPRLEEDEYGHQKQPRDSSRVKVWKFEEKQSDVNVALEAVYDAITDTSLEQVVFVTNDTDIVPALKKIRAHNELKVRNRVNIGLIVPANSGNADRRPNASLSDLADWTIDYIQDAELAASQLPCRLRGSRTTALKPTSWFKYRQKVEEILEILSDEQVERSPLRAWNWLSRPLHPADGLPMLTSGSPADWMDDEGALAIILAHVKAYAEFKKTRATPE